MTKTRPFFGPPNVKKQARKNGSCQCISPSKSSNSEVGSLNLPSLDIRVSALRLFCLAPVGSPVMLMALSFCCFNGWPAQDGAHTGKLSGRYVSCVAYDSFIPRPGCVFPFGFACLLFCSVGFVCLYFFFCGMTSYGIAPRIQEACHSIGFTSTTWHAGSHGHLTW